jgi:hypothetical protein
LLESFTAVDGGRSRVGYRLFTMQGVFGDADGICDAVGVEYVSSVPRPPLDELIDDLYYLEGAPPDARLTLPAD